MKARSIALKFNRLFKIKSTINLKLLLVTLKQKIAMKLSRQWVFYTILIIWLAILGAMIYALVYAQPGSFAKQYSIIIALFFITFTQFVKRAYRYSFKTEQRIRK